MLIVLANRAPFTLERTSDNQVGLRRSASGLVTALEPLVTAYSGIWVAHGASIPRGGGVLDRGSLLAPPANPRYRIRYVELDAEVHRGYYYGFANEALWPLCHAVGVEPIFRADDFHHYRSANARFADEVSGVGGAAAPIVLVQDYHFALAPRLLRRRLPASTLVAFWHIPWPEWRRFRTCPWHRELVDGLLGSDIVGLQTPEDCAHFLDSVRSIGAWVDDDRGLVVHRGQVTRVRSYPVGVEWNNQHARLAPAASVCRMRACGELHLPSDIRLGVGIDRLDYTKGIKEKFLTVERLLERYPEYRRRFVLVQVAEPSRECLAAYRAVRAEIELCAARVNARFGEGSYRPVVLLERRHEPDEIYRLYRAADLCYVNSLRDGMNLVAKEFVSARSDHRGVLVLSRSAGASHQLRDAVGVNPGAIDESAAALARALQMPDAEQEQRMRRMRQIVEHFDTYWWADRMLKDAVPANRFPIPAAAGGPAEVRPAPLEQMTA
jgi:trehalose 6-phosphate synthase